MLSPAERKRFFKLVRRFKKLYPIGPVKVRFVDFRVLQAEGETYRTASGWWIRLGKHLSLTGAEYALCEEWAHARVWDQIDSDGLFESGMPEVELSKALHCGTWAIEYGRLVNTRTEEVLA